MYAIVIEDKKLVLRDVPELLVQGLPMRPPVYWPFLDLLRQQELHPRRAGRAGRRAAGRGAHAGHA